MPDPSTSLRVHDKFNFTNRDVTIQSSDGVQFNLHRKNLESHTGGFPCADFDVHDEVVHLTENAAILEVVFLFVYPQRYPMLEDLPFGLLVEVAEAVEKYEVFAAMRICTYALRKQGHLETHAIDILAHALKHDYPELVDLAAPYLLFSDTSHVADKLPIASVFTWFKYQQLCLSKVFKAAEDYLAEGIYDKICFLPNSGHMEVARPHFCPSCSTLLFKWLRHLRRVPSREKLKEELGKHYAYPFYEDTHCRNCTSTAGERRRCIHTADIIRLVQQGLNDVPTFSRFSSGEIGV